MLYDVSWDGDLNGFSGSPVILEFKSEDGRNYALAGMLVSGGAKKAQFIRISLITQALKFCEYPACGITRTASVAERVAPAEH
jgi:hypothetical protein